MSQSASLQEIFRPLLALIVTSTAIMGSPGPSTISATAMGAAFGLRGSLAYVGGLIAGTIGVLLAVAIGIAALVFSIPHAARVVNAAAAIYILYLAFKLAAAPPLHRQGGRVAAPAFVSGLLLAIANPKAYLAIAAVFAGATLFAGDPFLDAIVKTAILSAMIVVIHFVWLLAGASLSQALHDPRSSRFINIALAAALAATAWIGLIR